MTSCNAPMAWSRASSMDAIPMSRLSRSMLSALSSRVKSTDARSYGSTHWSRGSPRTGEPLPTDVRARDDSSPAPSAADPNRHDVPTGMPPPVMEGVSGADANLSPSTTTPENPSATSPSVQPAPAIIAWATDGTGHAADGTGHLGDAIVASSCDPSVMVVATSTYIGWVMTSYIKPITIGAMSVVGSVVRPAIGSGITPITSYSVDL